jgi:hypothetical protein
MRTASMKHPLVLKVNRTKEVEEVGYLNENQTLIQGQENWQTLLRLLIHLLDGDGREKMISKSKS